MRWWCLLAVLSGCQNDDPTMALQLDESGQLVVALIRGPDHQFGHVTASANGIDLGPPQLAAGSDGKLFDQAASGAMAWFRIDPAALGEGLQLDVREDSDVFAYDAPTFGTPRRLDVVTALDQPLHAGDWIEVGSGVATDKLGGGFSIQQGTDLCGVQWSTDVRASSVRFELAPDLANDWWCGMLPAAGSVVPVTLSIDLDPVVAVASCRGPALHCDPLELTSLHTDLAVQLQF